MFKKLLTVITTLCAAAAFAAVDVNTATEAELDGIKGIGPGLSSRILSERQSAPFADWSDFIGRVGGVGPKSAAAFSKDGLTVNGKKYSAAAAARAEAKAKGKDHQDKDAKKASAGARNRSAAQPPAPQGDATLKPEAAAPAAPASATKN